MSDDFLPQLRNLLAKRLEIIADHAFRDSDPTAHLEALKRVSVGIEAFREANWNRLDARLKHFLVNASYQKALDWIQH